MSALSATATTEVFKQESDGFLVLLTINHETLGDNPIMVVNNTENITSNGDLYLAFPFGVKLPNDRSDEAPVAQLQIDNVSQELASLIRSISSPPDVAISVIRMDDFDAVEMSLPTFQLRNVQWNALQMTGDLTIDDATKEPFPARAFTPAEYPGLM